MTNNFTIQPADITTSMQRPTLVTVAKHFLFLIMLTSLLFSSAFCKAQDVLVGLTSNGGPDGKGTVFSLKANGTNFSIIKSFADWGKNPTGDLVKGDDGNFYGMTYSGGAYNYGTIFKMTPAGAITLLKQFNYTPDGANPNGELIKGNDGNFYGLTSGGGANTYGTIFKITPAGVFTVIRHLSYASDGSNPRGHLVLAKDGNFYGITYHGGAYGYGTIFKLTPAGVYTVLRSLNLTTDGGNSLSSLTEGKDGNLYGITYSGGTNSAGTIFKITTSGAFTVLRNFNNATDGSGAQGDLMQATDGNFYGMCYAGGTGGVGTIFKITPTGTYTVIRHLIWTTDGSNPYGNLMQNSDGMLYGMCSGGGPTRNGVFFKISTAGVFTVLHGFESAIEGANPKGSLVKGNDGNLYGLTNTGGRNFWGTAFKVTTTGAFTLLNSLDGAAEGNAPYENLIKGRDSAYYGTTSSGGTSNYGTIFKICGGKTTVLRSFNRGVDGGTPKGSLIQATDGNFYGMTTEGGTYSYGTIFKMTPSGVYTVLRHLNSGTDGGAPQGSLIQGIDGNLYGMTTGGGSNNSGTIFKITLSGTFTVLHHFIYATEGSAPEGSLMQDTDGTLYGMTSNTARIFKITTTGTFTILRTMSTTTDGSVPTGSFVKGKDGNFYATASSGGTYGFGTIFRISPAGVFKVLKHLNTTPDGKTPRGKLLVGNDGNFYGMTNAGGANGAGTLFKITTAGAYTVLRHFNLIADGGTPFGGLIIAPVNNLVANAQSITTTEDIQKAITLTGSGGSPLSYNIVAAPKRGKVTGTGANRTYIPNANYSGKDSFTFNVSVGCISSAPAMVRITVTPVNDTPVLSAIGNKTVAKNSTLTFTATATDVDAGQTKTFSLVTRPTGSTINATTGVFNWTPTSAGTFIAKVRVTDNGSPALYDEEQITVTVTNTFATTVETSGQQQLTMSSPKAVLYPNPVADKCYVTLSEPGEEMIVRVINLQGVVISTGKYNIVGKNRLELNVEQLKRGIYLLQLESKERSQTLRFIKK